MIPEENVNAFKNLLVSYDEGKGRCVQNLSEGNELSKVLMEGTFPVYDVLVFVNGWGVVFLRDFQMSIVCGLMLLLFHERYAFVLYSCGESGWNGSLPYSLITFARITWNV